MRDNEEKALKKGHVEAMQGQVSQRRQELPAHRAGVQICGSSSAQLVIPRRFLLTFDEYGNQCSLLVDVLQSTGKYPNAHQVIASTNVTSSVC